MPPTTKEILISKGFRLATPDEMKLREKLARLSDAVAACDIAVSQSLDETADTVRLLDAHPALKVEPGERFTLAEAAAILERRKPVEEKLAALEKARADIAARKVELETLASAPVLDAVRGKEFVDTVEGLFIK